MSSPNAKFNDNDLDDLADLFENAPCGYVAADGNSRIIRANATFENWCGCAHGELNGRRFHDLLNVAGKIFYETHFFPLLLMQGFFNEVALDMVRSDGSSFPVLVNAILRSNIDAAKPFLRITIFNATDRRKYEHELLAAQKLADDARKDLLALNNELENRIQERTRSLDRTWRISTDLLAVASEQGILEQVNPSWHRLLGWEPADLIGSNFASFTHPDDLAMTETVFQSVMAKPLSVPFEYRFLHKDGSYRWFGWTAAYEDGRVYATGRDTTSVHEQDDALQRANEQIRQSQKMEAIGQLTGGLAHDFNNLLAGISGSLELMEARIRQGRVEECARYLRAAQGAAKRAATLTHRLLAFSRQQTLDPQPTDVNRLMLGLEELIMRTVGPSIRIELVGSSGLWAALVDANQLENAVLNLCINARDAMPNGGSITLETANKSLDSRSAAQHDMLPGQYLSLCVTDTGTGMSPEIIARAFEPFFTTKEVGRGTGLGLSMVYGFAKQSGGQVRIYSEVGHGTTICIYLPRHYGSYNEEAHPESILRQRASKFHREETILIVDDEPTVRMLISEVADELGISYIEAADSATGLTILKSDVQIDLLITDIGLPGGMTGKEMVDLSHEVRPNLKVIFITGYAENAMLSNGRLNPGTKILTKPFSLATLSEQIEAVLRQMPP